jgi:hypothetical protein
MSGNPPRTLARAEQVVAARKVRRAVGRGFGPPAPESQGPAVHKVSRCPEPSRLSQGLGDPTIWIHSMSAPLALGPVTENWWVGRTERGDGGVRSQIWETIPTVETRMRKAGGTFCGRSLRVRSGLAPASAHHSRPLGPPGSPRPSFGGGDCASQWLTLGPNPRAAAGPHPSWLFNPNSQTARSKPHPQFRGRAPRVTGGEAGPGGMGGARGPSPAAIG